MRASVGHLTRNILITSANSWNCRIYSGIFSSVTKKYEG